MAKGQVKMNKEARKPKKEAEGDRGQAIDQVSVDTVRFLFRELVTGCLSEDWPTGQERPLGARSGTCPGCR